MDRELFQLTSIDPSWELFPGEMNWIAYVQYIILDRVVSHRTANALMVQQTDSKTFYSFDQLLTDLEAGIWRELKDKGTIDIYRRNLQKMYVEKLIAMTAGYFATRNFWDKSMYPIITITDVYPIVRDHLKSLSQKMDKASSSYNDRLTQLHFRELRERINNALKDFPNSWLMMENTLQPTKRAGLTNLRSEPDFTDPLEETRCWQEQIRLPSLRINKE
jgi:hypothetical protein